jgi:hypothetical protein
MGLRVTIIKIGPKHDVSIGMAQEAMIFGNEKEEKGWKVGYRSIGTH